MVFQDASSYMDPLYVIGDQLMETVQAHARVTKEQARQRGIELLSLVGIPDAADRMKNYPHQFSGGMQQRALIAMAIANNPSLIILDDPTRSLDVTIQAQVMQMLDRLREKTEAGILLISSNVALMSQFADDMLIMYGGRCIEMGPKNVVIGRPHHPHTKSLIEAIPVLEGRASRAPESAGRIARPLGAQRLCVVFGLPVSDGSMCRRGARIGGGRGGPLFGLLPRPWRTPEGRPLKARCGASMTNHETPILEIVDAHKYYDLKTLTVIGRVREKVKAVRGVSLKLVQGEALGLVGESGCGKSTLARLIVKLETPHQGSVFFRGQDIFQMSPKETKETHRRIQLIFQNPFSSLSPAMTIGDHVADALAIHNIVRGKAAIKERAKQLLDTVGIGREVYGNYPSLSSAGDLQLANIARALATNPEILISDEGISVLDASEQAKILNLLKDLQEELKLTYIIITHDLSVVRHICDRLVVMYLGKVMEIGDNASVFSAPINPYTKALIELVPSVAKGLRDIRMTAMKGEVPSPIHLPPGCTFAPRCELATDICRETEPGLIEVMPGRSTACHHWAQVTRMHATV